MAVKLALGLTAKFAFCRTLESLPMLTSTHHRRLLRRRAGKPIQRQAPGKRLPWAAADRRIAAALAFEAGAKSELFSYDLQLVGSWLGDSFAALAAYRGALRAELRRGIGPQQHALKPRDIAAEDAAIAAEDARQARLDAIQARRASMAPVAPIVAEAPTVATVASNWQITGTIHACHVASVETTVGPLSMPWRSKILAGWAKQASKNWLDVGQDCLGFDGSSVRGGSSKPWDSGLPRAHWTIAQVDGQTKLLQARRGNAPGNAGTPFTGNRREYKTPASQVAHLVGDAADF